MHYTAMVPHLFGTRDWFHGRQFSRDQGVGGWFQDDSSTSHSSSPPAVLLVSNRPGLVSVCSPKVGDPYTTG